VRFEVRVGRAVRDKIEQRYGLERTAAGRPSRRDFDGGPLAAAELQFRRFDLLPEDIGPSVRHCHVLVPGFSPVVFVGLLVAADVVEIADFEDDPDYWDRIDDDPRE
jgi:hypothetical protein